LGGRGKTPSRFPPSASSQKGRDEKKRIWGKILSEKGMGKEGGARKGAPQKSMGDCWGEKGGGYDNKKSKPISPQKTKKKNSEADH